AGDAVVEGRAAHAEAFFGDAEQEFLAVLERIELVLRDRCTAAAFLVVRRLGLDLFVGSAAALCRLAEIGVARLGRNLDMLQDRQRDHVILPEQLHAAHADRAASRENAYIVDREADALAAARRQQNIVLGRA